MLRPRWRKVLADLWGNKARTLLVVASIAVGVLAIGVITGTYVYLSEDLNDSYAASNPGNISLLTYPFEEDLVDVVRRLDSVAEAEGRREVPVYVRVGNDMLDTLLLTAVPDFEDMSIHRLFPREGVPVPGDQEVVLAHKTLKELDIAVGDVLEIELADGTRRELPVVGTGLDQSDLEELILGELRGYVTFDTLEWLHQPATMTRLYVTVAENPDDKAHIRQVATEVTDRLEESGWPVLYTQTSLKHQHPLDGILRAMLLVLIIVGVLIVFLSSSLIANTMSALLGQHLRQIGVMKLIGARRSQVITMYMVLILSFGILALFFAIPLGNIGAYALSRYGAVVINFRLGDFRFVPQAVVIQVVVGLLIPPVAGLLPVLKGSTITVRKALSSTGIGDGKKKRESLVDRILKRLRALSRPLLISIRNTFRRKARLALTLITLTLGGAVFIAVFNSQVALDDTVEQATRYFGADVNLDFAQEYRIAEVLQEATSIPGVASVEVWTNTAADLLRDDDGPSDTISVIAPPADSALIEPKLLDGRWILPDDENAITVNEAFWDIYPDLQAGDTLRLKVAGREDDWKIVGIFQYTGNESLVAYANYDYLAELLKRPYHASTFRIKTVEHNLAYQEGVAAYLDTHFRDLNYKVAKVEAGKALTSSMSDMLGILTMILLVMALMTALVGSIGLTGTMSMNVMERTREIGVLRAIGAYNKVITKLVIVEGLIIGVISYIFGGILSFPISALLSNVISLTIFNTPAQLSFTAQGFLIWFGVVGVLSAVASIVPARNATRLTIREVLAYE